MLSGLERADIWLEAVEGPEALGGGGPLRRLLMTIVLLSALLAVTVAAQARPAGRDSVVSYFRDRVITRGGSSWVDSTEWHVYDPARRTDRLLITLQGVAEVIQWDTTGTSVCFRRSYGFAPTDSIYRCNWRFGANPTLVAVDPPDHSRDYWFNPDSARWQASLQEPIASDTLWKRELWQADRTGMRWRRLRSDTVLVDPVDGPGEWAERAAMRREAGDSAPGAQQDRNRLDTEAVWFDTTTVSLYPGASRESVEAYWYFLPFRAAPRRGLAYRWETFDEARISAPIFVVDLIRHTKHLIEGGTHEGWCEPTHFGAERGGYAITSSCFEGPRIVDVRTGEIIFEGGSDTRDPVWVPAPLP